MGNKHLRYSKTLQNNLKIADLLKRNSKLDSKRELKNNHLKTIAENIAPPLKSIIFEKGSTVHKPETS